MRRSSNREENRQVSRASMGAPQRITLNHRAPTGAGQLRVEAKKLLELAEFFLQSLDVFLVHGDVVLELLHAIEVFLIVAFVAKTHRLALS